MFKMTANERYKSVLPFGEKSFQSLTVVLGINGSGKTNLLQAIKERIFTATDIESGTDFETEQIVFLMNGSSDDTGLVQPAQTSINTPAASRNAPAPSGMFGHFGFKSIKQSALQHLTSELLKGDFSATNHPLFYGVDIWALEPHLLKDNLSKVGILIELEDLQDLYKTAEQDLIDPTKNIHLPSRGISPDQYFWTLSTVLKRISRALGKSLLEITEKDFLDTKLWINFGIFNPQINILMVSYRDARARNDLELGASIRGCKNNYIDDSQFYLYNGSPPWLELDELLKRFNLPYTVKPPSHRPELEYNFTLLRIPTGEEVEFLSLSSGEKILLKFALSIFQYNPLRVSLELPRLLLLDEMDAPLHPEMVHVWLNAIQNTIVKELQINCILTTHSPTTVALAPEDALYQITAGSPGLKKITKLQALNSLTVGHPALSVDFEGRRQVFVESRTDAYVYDIISNLLKSDLDLHRTLNFMATGPSSGKAETNTGSPIVKYIVETLADNGNKSVFGVLDWDRKNISSSRIKVVGEGTHYALDNILMNPLLIGALLLRRSGLINGCGVTLSDLFSLTNTKAQELADAVQNKLIYPKDAPSGFQSVELVGGLVLQIKNEFALSNGHKMESALTDAFHPLKQFQPETPGNLNKAVAEHVLAEFKKLTPLAVANLIREIANQELE